MGCRDLIGSLPDEVLGKVLSLLPTKLAASTSVLSKRWRNLLALVDNLDFNDASGGDPRLFSDFVDKTLALLSNSSMAKRFYLNCQHKHDKSRVDSWIRAVLERGFLELGLKTECLVTNLLVTSNTLVKLTSSSAFYHPDGVLPLPLEGVFSFPALKTLSLSLSIGFINVKHEDDIIRKHRDMYAFLISACPVLEELVLHYGDFLSWSFMSTCPSIAVSSPSIKRLTISYHLYGRYPPKAEWLRTPSLVYLDYSGYITGEYVVDLGSLVEAKLDLRSRTSPLHGYVITYDDSYYGGEDNDIGCGDECHRFGVEYAVSYSACGEDDHTEFDYDHVFGGDGDSDDDGDGDDDAEDVLGDGDGDAEDVLGDVTVLVAGISNVKTLHLSCYSLEVFHFYCTSIPVFHNLLTLSFESHTFKGWQVVPLLLNNSPNLETLIIKGLMHRPTESCGDACPCIPRKKKKMEEEVCCLSTCHVKVLNISGYGGTRRERKMMWHFLGNLKCLETVKVGVEPEDYQRRLCLEDLKRCVNVKVGVEAENHREDSNVKAYRQRITNALMRLPKASSNCQIHVFFETK